MPYKILIADDNQTIRSRVRSLFEGEGWVVLGEAVNGLDAIHKTRELSPELVILNISMPMLDGFQALPEILASSPPPKVLIFTLHDAPAFRQKALDLGAHGLVVKSQPLADLFAAAEKLLAPES